MNENYEILSQKLNYCEQQPDFHCPDIDAMFSDRDEITTKHNLMYFSMLNENKATTLA